MFRENVAYVSGGAIYVMGLEVSTFLVDDSVFDANAVRTPPDTGGVEVTLRINTGGFNIATAEWYAVPIWRVDDAPVYGIPWDFCQSAAEYSQDAIDKGLPPSWPSLQCANISYTGPDASYSHVISLTQGPHTLYTGLMVMVSLSEVQILSHAEHTPHGAFMVLLQNGLNVLGWQQAWIEVVDSIGPLYPPVPET